MTRCQGNQGSAADAEAHRDELAARGRAALRRALQAAAVVAGLLGGCLLLPGCAALHWGGEDAGRTPGVHVVSPGLLNPGEISITSQLQAEVEELVYVGPQGDQPATFKLRGKFGQDVASVVREQPAKLQAIADVQRVQVEYVGALLAGVRDIVREIVPVLNLLAAARIGGSAETGFTLTLPDGAALGGQRVASPADLQAILQAAAQQAQTVSRVAGPASRPAQAAP